MITLEKNIVYMVTNYLVTICIYKNLQDFDIVESVARYVGGDGMKKNCVKCSQKRLVKKDRPTHLISTAKPSEVSTKVTEKPSSSK